MITAQAIVDLLNEAFQLDPGAMHALICNRVPCNAALAAHPSILIDGRMMAAVPGKPDHEIPSAAWLGIMTAIVEMEDEDFMIRPAFEYPDGPEGRPRFVGFSLKRIT